MKRNPCKLHRLVGAQTFSAEEGAYYLQHAERFSLCSSCVCHYEKVVKTHDPQCGSSEGPRAFAFRDGRIALEDRDAHQRFQGF